MTNARRSGRISKEVPVILLGTDTNGRVFSEETTTLVLSRHGAGILSHHKLAPDEILTLRQVGFNPEAEARLVGQMGQHGSAYVYGVEFADPHANFLACRISPIDRFRRFAWHCFARMQPLRRSGRRPAERNCCRLLRRQRLYLALLRCVRTLDKLAQGEARYAACSLGADPGL